MREDKRGGFNKRFVRTIFYSVEIKNEWRYQYSETNVMHFSINLLSINGIYIILSVIALPQEALHKLHLVYCVRVMSVGCNQDWSGTGVLILNRLNEKCITLVSLY
jgi:hypothetical protein